jgi:hypothetical protein
MSPQIYSKIMADFQQIFAADCVLMTKICIFLFFHKIASKSQQLLIISACLMFRIFQPNHAKKLFLWRYIDTKISSRSKKSYKNDDSFQPLQTFADYPQSQPKQFMDYGILNI